MATRYWVGGTGNWDALSTARWSATSGGPGGASVPTANDDVIFNSASSGASYEVACGFSGLAVCKSITTTAPATGTLTFRPWETTETLLFTVFNGNVNIHAACLYSYGAGLLTISHTPTIAGTYTVTFNSPGVNTQELSYSFLPSVTGVTLNFCSSNTATFQSLNLEPTTFICTNAVLTNGSLFPGFTLGSLATSITMTGTTINSGDFSSDIVIGGSNTTTWAISTLAVNINSNGDLYIGQNATVQPTAMGAVTFTDSVSSAWFTRATTLTLNKSSVAMLTGLTTTGAVSLASSTLITTGTSSFGSTITGVVAGAPFSGSQMYFEGTTTVTGAVSFTGETNFPNSSGVVVNGTATFNSTLGIVNSGSINGTGSLISGDITIANSAGGSSLIGVANLTTTSLVAPNTSINMSGALVVNGGVGKTFSFNYSIAEGTQLRFGSLTVSTPTCTIAGTATSPVHVNQPISSTNPSFRPFTRTGAAPTLSYVNFFGTTINGGGTNYSGTKLGTDGLSSGFLPETPKTVYLIVTSPQPASLYSAIWTLAPSGGTGSTANIPLPQDTVSVNDGYGSGFDFAINSTTCYLGSIVTSGSVFGGNNLSFTFSTVYLFGDLRHELYSGTTTFSNLYFAKSGNTNRYLTITGSLLRTQELDVDVGSATTLTVSGSSTPTVVSSFSNSFVQLRSGTISIASGVAIGSSTAQFTYFNVYNGATVSGGGWVAHTNAPTYELGAIVTSSNYVMNLYFSGAASGRYTNLATTTALNGALVIRSNTSSPLYLASGSTTSTNPMRYIEFNSGVSSGANVLSLEGDAYVQNLYSSNTNAVTTLLQSFGGPWTVYKTNGGTAYLQRYTATTTVFNVLAAPANTFYTNGTLVGTTTGWNSGAPPASPPSGGFLFF